MNKNRFIKAIEDICPREIAEPWDNCGFQINSPKEEIGKVLIALEVTGEVIDEAEKIGAELILTHHPLIFGSLNAVDSSEVIGNYIFRLIRSGIDVYSCHTNFDKTAGGNNDYLGEVLKMAEITAFDAETGEAGKFCKKGKLPEPMTLSTFADYVAEKLSISGENLRYIGKPSQKVSTAGWCTGSGAEFIKSAYSEGVDVYITGDVKYHDAQMAMERGIAVIDAGHYGTEKIFAENMGRLLREKIESAGDDENGIEIFESKADINPFKQNGF